jgi:glycosyltransferase involved in cell wall biosynthesis
VSDGPGFQAVQHGKNGLVFRAGDAAALAASILALLRNRGLARHLGGAAKEFVQDLRTTAIVRRYDELMMEVAAGGWGR